MTNPYRSAEAFAKEFRHVEYALKRSEFLKFKKEVAEVDWDRFARALGKPFYDHIVAAGIAKTLVGAPPRRLLNDLQWGPPNPAPLANITQLIVSGVCRVRNSYIHGEKFTGGPEGQWERDLVLIQEAHAVLKEAMTFPAYPLPS